MEQLAFDIEAKIMRENIIAPLIKLLGVGDKKESKDVLVSFECTKDVISIKEHTSVLSISFELDEGIINNYINDLKDNETSRIMVDLHRLSDAFSDLDGIVSFDLNSENKKLILMSGFYTYELGLKISTKSQKFPIFDKADNVIDMIGEDTYKIFKKCSGVNKFINIKLSAETEEQDFALSFISRESGTNTKATVKLSEFDVKSFNTVDNSNNMYDAYGTGLLDVLKESVTRIPQVSLRMKDNYPLVITYNIIEDHGKAVIGIAPRKDQSE